MVIGVDVSRTQSSVLTGTERYTYEVVRRLPELLPEITWRFYSAQPFHQRWSSVSHLVDRRVVPSRLGTAWTHTALVSELTRHPVDLMFFPGTAIPFTYRRPTVTTIHDLVFITHPHLYNQIDRAGWQRRLLSTLLNLMTLGRIDGSERKYQRWAFQHALAHAAHIISVSQATTHAIEQFSSTHPPIETIPLGLETVTPSSDGRHVSASAEAYFLYIGRLERKKNIDRLLEAYTRYRTLTTHPWSLKLVGQPGYGWSESERRQAELFRDGYITVHSSINDTQREEFFQHAGALLLVSEAEGFGLPPFEAAQRHLPVIASPVGAIPEILGNAYIRIDPTNVQSITDAMVLVSSNPAAIKEQTDEAWRRVEGLTWDSAAKKTAGLLKRVLLKLGHINGTITPL